jgi:hypothetical protein
MTDKRDKVERLPKDRPPVDPSPEQRGEFAPEASLELTQSMALPV